ncbi:hypothetical protein BJX62DRAFT_114383 [Aspergillus germanicus]
MHVVHRSLLTGLEEERWEILQRNSRRRGWRMRGHVRSRGALTRLPPRATRAFKVPGHSTSFPSIHSLGLAGIGKACPRCIQTAQDHLPDLGVTSPTCAGLRSKQSS